MIAEENSPLSCLGDRRRLFQNIDDRKAVFHVDRHEQARHHGEVEGHVALVAVAEVGDGVLGPLVRLGQQHPAAVIPVDVPPQFLQERVRLGKVLAVGAFALVQIRHGVEA